MIGRCNISNTAIVLIKSSIIMKNNNFHSFWLFIIFIFTSSNIFAQIDFWVPATPPKSEYKVDLDINFENKIAEGHGSIRFLNTGEKPLTSIAIDYTISDYSLMKIIQDGKPLEVYNPDNVLQVNSPVFFILDQAIKAGEQTELQLSFKKRLFLDDDFESFDTQNLIPSLWWDGIKVSNSFKVKINADQKLRMAVSGCFNIETGYYENDYVKNFGFYFSKTDNVIEEEICGILVRILYPANGKKVAELAMTTAKEAIPFYIELMGFYPYSFINIIPGGPGVWGGYPFASGIVVIHGMQFYDKGSVRHWRWITSHEIGHEYWGEFVLDGDDSPFLWIALGIYADWKFSQHIGLSDSKQRNWADYYLSGVKKGYNTIMDIRPEEQVTLDFDRNNYVIHAKGFSFISALEIIMGKETFQEAYINTLKKYGGKRLGNRDFQEICEETSGENLDWFFDTWLRSNKYVSAFLSSTSSVLENGKYHSTATVYHESDFFMPVPVCATFEDGSYQVKMTDRVTRKNVVNFISDSKLTGAVIDPSGCLANLDDYQETLPEDVILKIKRLPYSGAGDKANMVYRQAANSNREKIAVEWYRLGMALYDAGYFSQAKNSFYYALKFGPEEDAFINNVWFGHMNDLLGDRSTALEYYKNAMEAWDGGAYTHSQYNMTIDKSWVEQRLEEPFGPGKKLSWD